MKVSVNSIKDKLKNYSKKHNKIHQFTLTRYFQERLLFRLSKSEYRNKLLLKGGALMYTIQKDVSRPTLDIDLLAQKIKSEEGVIISIFTDICSLKFSDGITFDINSLSASEILKEGSYSGIRIKVPVNLGNIRQSLQVDIGFGDVVTPGPVEMDYPTLLEMEIPKLLTYSIESLVAEKFQAMIDLAEYNSRMKDFYDVYKILESGNYSQANLKQAIRNTFEKRKTVFMNNHSLFGKDFKNDKNRIIQWEAFLKKSKVSNDLEYGKVMELIKLKLEPIYADLK